jgi:hypothetical protein
MDATIGYITLNNIDKAQEYFLVYAFIFIGLTIGLFLKSVRTADLFYPLQQRITAIEFANFSIISLLIFACVSMAGKNGFILYTLPPIISFILTRKKIGATSNDKHNTMTFAIALVLLSLKIVSLTTHIPTIVIALLPFIILYKTSGKIVFSFAVLIFYLKSFQFAPFIISDTFHGAEHFLAITQLTQYNSSIFSNLGLIEELPGYAITAFIWKITEGFVQIPITYSRTIASIILILYIFSKLINKGFFGAIILTSILPVDRLSLLFCLAITLLIIEQNERSSKLKINIARTATLSLIPAICIGLSPNYFLIIFIGIIYLLPLRNFNKKEILIIALSWLLFLLFGWDYYKQYIEIYLNISILNDIGFATSITSLNKVELIFWLLLLSGSVAVMTSSIIFNDEFYMSIVKLVLLAATIYLLSKYAFGRIDAGFTRLAAIATILLTISYRINHEFIKPILILILPLTIAYANPLTPLKINIGNFSFNNEKFQPAELSIANKSIVNSINEFANGRSIINYSMMPALTLNLINATPTYFTSPYVTLGKINQDMIIDQFERSPDSIIYLGESFLAFDGIDIRARAPLVFRHLAIHYQLVRNKDSIYAIRNNHHTNDTISEFFSNFDLKLSPIYFTNNVSRRITTRSIIIPCSGNSVNRYKISNTGNTFTGLFKCGQNKLPEVFFIGNTLSVDTSHQEM